MCMRFRVTVRERFGGWVAANAVIVGQSKILPPPSLCPTGSFGTVVVDDDSCACTNGIDGKVGWIHAVGGAHGSWLLDLYAHAHRHVYAHVYTHVDAHVIRISIHMSIHRSKPMSIRMCIRMSIRMSVHMWVITI